MNLSEIHRIVYNICKKEYLYMKRKKDTLVNLNDTIKRVIENVQPKIPQKISFDKELNATLHIDEVILKKIIRIFLENVSKTEDPKSVLKIALLRQGDSIDIAVSNEGVNFIYEEKKAISKLNLSDDTLETRTTIGLSLINEYAEACGAWFFLSDNFPSGNVFHLVFNQNQEKR